MKVDRGNVVRAAHPKVSKASAHLRPLTVELRLKFGPKLSRRLALCTTFIFYFFTHGDQPTANATGIAKGDQLLDTLPLPR